MTVLLFTPQSRLDFDEIGRYIARDNPHRALAYIRELRAQCRKIAQAPLAYRPRPELGKGMRACAHGNYIVFFTATSDLVRIIRVLHGSRDIEAQFAEQTPAATRTKGYTYLEVLVALLIFAIALAPAMEAIQSSLGGIRQSGAATTTDDASAEQAVINKMERLLALSPADLSTSPSGRTTPHATLSDPSGTEPRCLVYTSWYKPEEALEANRFVSVSTSKLLWIRVAVAAGAASAATLVFAP